jgi:hypothetical protein
MKTIILATAAVLGLGIGTAFAGDGEGPAPNTRFTEIPGVIAQAQVPQPSSALAANQYRAPTATYATGHSRSISLFPPTANQGNGS